MSELITPHERVRDLTSAPRRIPIETEGNVSHEVILTIWSAFNPTETNTAHDLGAGWGQGVRDKTPDDLAAEIVELGGPYCHVWLGISSLMLQAPHPHDPESVGRWLERVDEKRLRRWILGYSSEHHDQGLIEQAAEGDVEAALSLFAEKAEKKPGLLDFVRWMLTNEGLPGRYAAAFSRFRNEVFSEFEEEFAGAISRAAAARRAAPTRGSAKEVVEEVTSGIDFEIPLGVSRIVLLPSVVTRPLSLIDAHRGTMSVYYGVADEFINSDPEAPPSWLVRMYKALSDEKRLRILRRLSEGETSLDELTEMLDLSKSTVHHHISLLRGAGLIRIHVPSDASSGRSKCYTLREQTLADASTYLDSYLRTSDREERHA